MLDSIVKQHPEYDVTALLRNEPANFKSLYPDVHVVKGHYDSTDVLTEAASKADVVVRKSDHARTVPLLECVIDETQTVATPTTNPA